MSSEPHPKAETPLRDDDIGRIGAAMAKMRLLVGRRYIGRMAIARLGAGLELSHLDLLSIVNRLGRDREVTIGIVAEHMRIDHSRASRVVAELVKRGVLRREVSQEDARRTIVTLTEDGMAMIEQVHAIKHEVLTTALSDWTTEELAAFASLYNRFLTNMEQQAAASDASKTAQD